MPAIQTVCIAVLLIVVLLFDKCFGYPSIRQRHGEKKLPCRTSCGDSCNKCEFGVAMSPSCGRVCARGLNEICGGTGEGWGICGDGMFCICNKCVGCSTRQLNCTWVAPKKPCLPLISQSSSNMFQRHITK